MKTLDQIVIEFLGISQSDFDACGVDLKHQMRAAAEKDDFYGSPNSLHNLGYSVGADKEPVELLPRDTHKLVTHFNKDLDVIFDEWRKICD